MSETLPITDLDLDAYVDDQLDPLRRIEVEEFLSHNPEQAMRVMADLQVRDALRCTLPPPADTPMRCERTALDLQQGLDRLAWVERLRYIAVAAVLLAIGWAGHMAYGAWHPDMRMAVAQNVPTFVEDALIAHRTAQMRASMASQPRVTHLDADEILRATGIRLPALPRDWRVRDVQVFPSRSGPGVEVALEAGGLGVLSIFAGRATDGEADQAPVVSRVTEAGVAGVAYWQQGRWAYAVTTDQPQTDLAQVAGQLSLALVQPM
ncbi:anti-sigma factor family protein [Bordetella genomosp. 1]|uniref:anti-sigma factor family protein n=1 Tax=Bordetella genomosp. 1 TaxID=1395607 RepID=UPI0020CD7141|nr:hypothetical protein [Bordetella genomosp. 1]